MRHRRSLGEGRPPTGAKTEPLPGVGWGWGTNHQASEWGGTCLPHRAAVHGQDGACLVSQLPLDDETATLMLSFFDETARNLATLGFPGCAPGPAVSLHGDHCRARHTTQLPVISSVLEPGWGEVPPPLCTYPDPPLDTCRQLHTALSPTLQPSPTSRRMEFELGFARLLLRP